MTPLERRADDDRALAHLIARAVTGQKALWLPLVALNALQALIPTRAAVSLAGGGHAVPPVTDFANLHLAISLGTCAGLLLAARRSWMLRFVSHAAAFEAQLLIVLGFATLSGATYVITAAALDRHSLPSLAIGAAMLLTAAGLATLLLQLTARARVTVPGFLVLTWLLPSMASDEGRWSAALKSVVNLRSHLRTSAESSDSAVVTASALASSAGIVIIAALLSRRAPR